MDTILVPPTASASSNNDKPQAKLWLNIGIGETDATFLSLPFGMALDTMPEGRISGSAEWQALMQRRNAMLKQLTEQLMLRLEPGHSIMLPALRVQARRVNDKVVAPTATAGETFNFFG